MIQYLYLSHVFRLVATIHHCKTAFCALWLHFSALSHIEKRLSVFSKNRFFNGARGEETDPPCWKYAAKWLITYINPFSRARGVFWTSFSNHRRFESLVVCVFLCGCKDFFHSLANRYAIHFKWIHSSCIRDIYTFKSTPIDSLFHNESSNPYFSFIR